MNRSLRFQATTSRRCFLKNATAGTATLAFNPSLFAAAMSETPRPKALVLGGTAFALGVAVANPGRCVVIERGIHLAPEFSQTGDWGGVGEANTEHGLAILSAMESAGIVSAGRIELPPLSDFLHSYFADGEVALFFNAELVSFTNAPFAKSGRAVVFGGGSAGLCRVVAGQMLDTTDVGWRERGLPDVVGRRFSAIASSGLVSVDLPPEADHRLGRIRLNEAVTSAGSGNSVLAECNEMATVYRQIGGGGVRIMRMFDDGSRWIPSAQFGSFVEAFEEGLKCTLE